MNAYQRRAILHHLLWPVVTFQHEAWQEVLGVSPRDTVHVARALGFEEEEIAAALLTPSDSVRPVLFDRTRENAITRGGSQEADRA